MHLYTNPQKTRIPTLSSSLEGCYLGRSEDPDQPRSLGDESEVGIGEQVCH